MLKILSDKGNANKTTLKFFLILIKMAVSSITQTTNAGKDVGKKEHFYTADGNGN
jgi:hypothetical protein